MNKREVRKLAEFLTGFADGLAGSNWPWRRESAYGHGVKCGERYARDSKHTPDSTLGEYINSGIQTMPKGRKS